MKKIFIPLVVCLAGSFLDAADIQGSIAKLATDDFGVRNNGRIELKDAFAIATAPGASSAELDAMEQAVLVSLQDGKLPIQSQLYLLRILEWYGSGSSAYAVYPFLGDDNAEVRDSARRALTLIPGDQALKHLIAGLQGSVGEERAAYADALGERGDPEATRALAAYLESGDEALVAKVASALGKLGNADVSPVLLAMRLTVSAELKPEVEKALLDIGLDDVSAYALAGTGSSFTIRAAAFSQLIELDTAKARQVLLSVITQPDFKGRSLFFESALNSASKDLQEVVVDYLPTAGEADQAIIVASIGENDLEQYEAEVLALISSESKSLRLTVIDTLGSIGGNASFELLYEAFLADSRNPTIANAVARLQAPSADQKALAEVRDGSDVNARVAGMKILELRNVTDATVLLNEIAQSDRDDKVRAAGFKVLEKIGNLDTIKIFIDLILKGDSQTRALQTSLKRLSLNYGAPGSQWDAAYGPALERVGDTQAGEGIVRILDGVQSPQALKYLEGCILDVDSVQRSAAFGNLQRWSDVSSGDVWLKLAALKGGSAADVSLAQKALIKLLKDGDRSSAGDRVKLAVRAVQQAPSKEFKLAMLGVYENTPRWQKRSVKKEFKAIQDDPDVGATVNQMLSRH